MSDDWTSEQWDKWHEANEATKRIKEAEKDLRVLRAKKELLLAELAALGVPA